MKTDDTDIWITPLPEDADAVFLRRVDFPKLGMVYATLPCRNLHGWWVVDPEGYAHRIGGGGECCLIEELEDLSADYKSKATKLWEQKTGKTAVITSFRSVDEDEPLPAQPWAPGVGKHPTRGGGEAEVKFIMAGGRRVGVTTGACGTQIVCIWSEDGRSPMSANDDLMPPAPVPPQPEAVSESKGREYWVNEYTGNPTALSNRVYRTRELADRYAGVGRLRCVHVREVREGGAE